MLKKQIKKFKGDTQMSNLFLNRFKEYVNTHYSDCNLKITDICSNIGCSVSTLQRILASYYDYSIMKYVEYFRILMAIKFLCEGEKKVYHIVGYSLPDTFYRSFTRVTKLNTSYFCPYQDIDHESIVKHILNAKTEDPKKVIEDIINKFLNKIYTYKKYKKSRNIT
jgi:AraC-like DNA-binding protein